jgi:hypothetical protein
MAHNFDHMDALATARVERNTRPAAFTRNEGGEWVPPYETVERGVHSIWFCNGEQWDEHNGWRGRSFDEPFDASKLGWVD